MDDLFQYLIWGIIIFSFLSSFFKKKEPPKQTPLPKAKQPASPYDPNQHNGEIDRVVVSQKQDEYDILKELENLFKGEVNVPVPQKPAPSQTRDYEEQEIKDINLDKVSDARLQRKIEERRPTESRINLERKTALEQKNWTRKKVYVDPKVEATAAEFEKVLAGPKKQKTLVSEFNRKLKNPATIREYILFSEILGKPKALRR